MHWIATFCFKDSTECFYMLYIMFGPRLKLQSKLYLTVNKCKVDMYNIVSLFWNICETHLSSMSIPIMQHHWLKCFHFLHQTSKIWFFDTYQCWVCFAKKLNVTICQNLWHCLNCIHSLVFLCIVLNCWTRKTNYYFK